MAGFNGCTDAGNVKKTDIVNNLTSTATDKPGSANMLKTLNDKIESKKNVDNWWFSRKYRGDADYNDITIKNIPLNTGSGFIIGTSAGLLGFYTADHTLVSDSQNLTITNLGDNVYRFEFSSSWYRPVMLITSWDIS